MRWLKYLGIVIVDLVITLVLLLSFARILTPLLNDYLAHHLTQAEQWMSSMVHHRVYLSGFCIVWHGSKPSLVLQNVRVTRTDHQVLLRIQKVTLLMSLASLYRSLHDQKRLQAGIFLNGIYLNVAQSHPVMIMGRFLSKPWVIRQLSAYVDGGKNHEGWQWNLDHLLVNIDGKTWPWSQLTLRYQTVDNKPIKWTVLLPSLDVKNISDWLAKLPSLGKSQAMFSHIHPEGYLSYVIINWQKPLAKPWWYGLVIKTQFVKLGFQAYQKRPGVKNVSGSLIWQAQGGVLQLDSVKSTLSLPSLFHYPFYLKFWHMSLFWQKKAQGFIVHIPTLTLSDGHLSLNTQATLITRPTPYIRLQSSFKLHSPFSMSHYLPQLGLSSKLVLWLTHAFSQGFVDHGQMVLQGALKDFPYLQHQGRFALEAMVHHASLHYLNHWPDIKDINGFLHFDTQKMWIEAKTAITQGVHLAHMKASIDNLKAPHLKVSGRFMGKLPNGQDFLQTTPLKIKQSFKPLVFKGNMYGNLSLMIPLHHCKSKLQVLGRISTQNGQMNLPAWSVALSAIKGAFTFTQDSLKAPKVSARFLEQPAFFDIKTIRDDQKHPWVQVRLKSRINTSKWHHHWHGFSALRAKGMLNYQVVFHLYPASSQKPNDLTWQSNLRLLKIALPEPFRKPLGIVTPFSAHVSFPSQKPLEMTMHYGHLLQANMQWLKQGGRFRLQKGTFYIGDSRSKFSLGDGIFVKVNLPKLNVEAWKSFFHSHVSLTKLGIYLARWPYIEMNIDKLWYQKHLLGRWYLHAKPTPLGLDISSFALALPQVRVQGQARWVCLSSKQQYTTLKARLSGKSIGEALKQWHLTDVIAGGHGSMNLALSFHDAPMHFSLAKAKGYLVVNMQQGRILKLSKNAQSKLGLGRFLNLLSLKSLPHHLFWHFSDLSEKGFAFDEFRGYFSIKNGQVMTHHASFEGAVANVLMDGRIGLLDRIYDLHIGVQPKVTNSLPVMAAMTAGPVVGAITWFLNTLFVEPTVSHAAMEQYQIRGSWKHPIVKQVS